MLEHFEGGNAIKILNGIMLNRFLPETVTYTKNEFKNESLVYGVLKGHTLYMISTCKMMPQ